MNNLGFGLMRLPLTDPNDRSSVNLPVVKAMIDCFLQHGGKHFDTGYFYHGGKSESIFGELVAKRFPRGQYSVTAKLPVSRIHNILEVEDIFAQQLARCHVDYFDYYLLHGIGRKVRSKLQQLDAFSFLTKLKTSGMAKNIGFSYHDDAIFLEEILSQHPEIDVVQLQLNYVDWDSIGIQSKQCYDVCEKYGVEVIVMEPLKGGALVTLPEKAASKLKAISPHYSIASWGLRFAFSLERVKYVLSGMSTIEQVYENSETANRQELLSNREISTLKEVIDEINAASIVACTACNYCIDVCPQRIPIPMVFSLINDQHHFGFRPSHRITFSNLVETSCSPLECLQCGRCEDICPQKLAIPQLMNKWCSVFVK